MSSIMARFSLNDENSMPKCNKPHNVNHKWILLCKSQINGKPFRAKINKHFSQPIFYATGKSLQCITMDGVTGMILRKRGKCK